MFSRGKSMYSNAFAFMTKSVQYRRLKTLKYLNGIHLLTNTDHIFKSNRRQLYTVRSTLYRHINQKRLVLGFLGFLILPPFISDSSMDTLLFSLTHKQLPFCLFLLIEFT
jgi:hypothetical protein